MEFGRDQQIAFGGDGELFCLGIGRENRTEPQNREGCFIHMGWVCIWDRWSKGWYMWEWWMPTSEQGLVLRGLKFLSTVTNLLAKRRDQGMQCSDFYEVQAVLLACEV